MNELTAFYERTGEQSFVATAATQSPWDSRLQHGSPPTALLAQVIGARHPRADMRVARIAADFLGAIPLGKMAVKTRVLRPGKRIELLEGVIETEGREVVTARVWRIAVQQAESVPPAQTPPDAVPPLPARASTPAWLHGWGYGEAFDWRYVFGDAQPGPAAVWARPRVALIAGEPLQALDRALLLVDSANGISGELPMGEWLFVPPALSVALERYPRGDWTLLEARTTLARDGIGITTSRLADESGFFATGQQALLVERRRP